MDINGEPSPEQGPIDLMLNQDGSELSGQLRIVKGSVCLSEQPEFAPFWWDVSGSVNGSTVELEVEASATEYTFTGTVTLNSIKGTWTGICVRGGDGKGHWAVSR